MIDTWHDRRLVPGTPIDRAISARLEEAKVILPRRALERHEAKEAVVIPVILRPCDWHDAPFGGLLALPKDGRPVTKWPDLDEAFLDITTGIKAALSAGGSARTPRAPSPATPTPTAPPRPRSSNLRVANQFSQRDREDFIHEAFEYAARYFENSVRS